MKQLKLIVNLLQAIYELLQVYRMYYEATQSPSSPTPEWLDKQEVMTYLKITESTYYRWVKKGILQPRGSGGQHRFFREDLVFLFERRKYRERL
ncbi:MAG: helix-turn-helix domain-containing protein, partial [Olivibacter sp.]|nr:helix-turn-helix domain-containing protein [Olivibacter sp. UJ_SKK_5.1]